MAIVNKQDTDGTKQLLGEGEFGYDAYPAGGDEGRLYIGTGAANIPQARYDEIDQIDNTSDADKPISDAQAWVNTQIAEVTGTESLVRYDKKLSAKSVINMLYTVDTLTTVIYEGDDGSTLYYRDVLEYTGDELTTVKHYYGTVDLVTQSSTTVLGYTNGSLTSATYSE